MPLAMSPRRIRQDFDPLIAGWALLLDDYQSLSGDDPDVAYWHSEPALTGTLVSAAWRIGRAGLAEFATARTRPTLSGAGRGDAYLLVSDTWYAAEAKLAWVIDDIDTCLRLADDDLTSLRREDRAERGIVFCFFTPRCSTRPQADFLVALARQLDEKIRDADILAVYEPIGGSQEDDSGYWWPGAVLIGRIREWHD